MRSRAIGLIAAALIALTASPAIAAGKKHHHRVRHHNPRVQVHDANGNIDDPRYCHPETKAGRITISCKIADRMAGFINDVVERGFKGRVHCLSYSKSHVANSLHFVGEACDFAQRGWGKTVAVMYRVRDLADKWGLRDGCTFKDCGHIDSGRIRTARR